MRQFTILTLFLLTTLTSNAQIVKWAESLNNYSFDLYNQLKTENENLFISPLSTYYALVIGYEGAKSETKQEFEKVLHIESYTNLSDFPVFYQNLATCNDSSNQINIANAFWIQRDLTLESDYKNKITQTYLSDIKTVDFNQKMNASSEINSWITDQTNGLINNIINPSEINEYTQLIISNAILFTGKWDDEFDKSLTKSNIFYSTDKSKTEIQFMNKLEFLKYYENTDFQFISKNYEGGDKSFCVILPKKRYGLIDFESTLSPYLFDLIFNNSKSELVKMSIPKFKFETSYSLVEPLKKLGLINSFTPNANFSGITAEGPLKINQVNHKAYIEVNEEKTEADAVTNISLMVGNNSGTSPKYKVFNADHPFIFMIVDNKTKGIIFIGRYVRP